MLSKTKKLLFLTTGLAGALVVSSAAGVALSSCTVEAVNGGSNSSDGITLPDTWYNKDINWSDATSLNNLIIDKQGFVYSNKYKTEIIAILPGYESSTLVIPSTVTSITGYNKVTTTTGADGSTSTTKTITGAFEGLTSITNVKFAGKNVTQIGPRAFFGCTSLQTVTLPSSVNLIANNAFGSCSSLNTIDLSNIQYIGANAFENAFTAVPYGSISLNLNKTVLIAANAFQSALGVGSVDFSKNTTITQIAENAFSGCTNLSGDIDLSSATKLITIGSTSTPSTTGLSFANTAITNVYLPSTLRTIAAQTFSGCTNLENVGPKGNTTGFTAVEGITGIYNKAFAGTKITSVNVSTTTSTTPLQNGAFSGMANLTEVNLGSTITSIPAACFANCTSLTTLSLPDSITSISGGQQTFTNITLNSTTGAITNSPNVSFTNGDINYPPFYGSGLTSIDLSNITSYQTTVGSTLNLPNTLFYNCPNLTTVILKDGTTAIGDGSFVKTPELTTISTGSSSTTQGYIAAKDITSVGQYAFWQSGISSVDLSSITSSSFTTLKQVTFVNCPNLTTIKLPSTITTIDNYSINTTPKLTTVNFDNLNKLTTISMSNFDGSSLEDINLSGTIITNISVGSFKNLPTTAQVYFPTTLNDGFSGIFTDISGNTIPFNFPNGINSGFFTGTNINSILSNSVLQNIQTSTMGKANVLRNVGILNLSNVTAINSIGVNTFFGSSKLSSLTLPAKIVASSANTNGMFKSASDISANNNNQTDVSSSSYITSKVPFGLNEEFRSLNYTNFTSVSNGSTEGTTNEELLYNLTNSTTWSEVQKIINSLSYQEDPTEETVVSNLKPNMSTWQVETNDAKGNAINNDASLSWTTNSLNITNSYDEDGSNSITINSTDTTKTFIHNGVNWTYTNNGTSITLTGNANMYKATKDDSTSYLVFFNQSTYSVVSDTTTIYYIPSRTPVAVTLTIATATTSNS